MTAGLLSYRPNRRVYASKSAGVLSNKVVTSGNSKKWALWVIKLYCKLISSKDYLNKSNKRSYILSASFVPNAKMYKFCWISQIQPGTLDLPDPTGLLNLSDPIRSIIA